MTADFDFKAFCEEARRKPRLLKNAARCLGCGDVIESRDRHDFVTCSCGRLSVDGGLDYERMLFHEDALYERLSVYETPAQVAARLSAGAD